MPTHVKKLRVFVASTGLFICYHAAVALLNAVRTLDKTYYEKLNIAIEMAKKRLIEAVGSSANLTDSFAVLNEAQKELKTLIDKQEEKV